MIKDFDGIPVQVQRRSYQRSVNLHVLSDGTIKVTAAKSVPEAYIRAFLGHSRDWIYKQKKALNELELKYPRKKFVEGESYLFMGLEHSLFIERLLTSTEATTEGRLKTQVSLRTIEGTPSIHVSIPIVSAYSDEQNVQMRLKAFYKANGSEALKLRWPYWSERMGLRPSKVTIRGQRTRWGSCGSNGVVSLNWKLIAAPQEVMDYVIIHELSHLVHQNHSQKFWNLVGSYDSNFKSHKRWLREQQWQFEFLN